MTNAALVNERRVFDRFSAKFPAKVKDSRQDYGQKLYLRDASAEGARVTTTEQMFLHDSIILDVKLPDKEYPMTLKGRVIWTKAIQPKIWDIGVKFHDLNLVRMSRLYQAVNPV